jgi:hypothetical protein
MSLVALDTLAEGLLFRHMETVFLVSDKPTWIEHRIFTAKDAVLPVSDSANAWQLRARS